MLGEAPRVYQAVTTSLEFTNRRLMNPIPIPLRLPLPSNKRFLAAKKTLDDVVFSMISARRRMMDHGGDLLAMLMDARDEETGEAMSDEQLRDEVMTLVLAGHETTANALTWTWMLLSREPVVWRKLRAEVEAVLGNRAVTAEDLPKLKFTRMVFEEAMRLYPPAWMFGRRAIGDDSIRGYRIPAGFDGDREPVLHAPAPAVLAEPGGLRSRALLPRGRGAPPETRVFPLRRRAADLHRERVRDLRGASDPRDGHAAVPRRGPLARGAAGAHGDVAAEGDRVGGAARHRTEGGGRVCVARARW